MTAADQPTATPDAEERDGEIAGYARVICLARCGHWRNPLAGPCHRCVDAAAALVDSPHHHGVKAAAVRLEAVVALGKEWVGFDDSHHYGDAVLRAALGES